MDVVEFPIQNAIYLFITTEIVELLLYIRKTGGLVLLVVKMSTPDPCHYVKKKLYSSSSFSIKLNTLRCSSIRSYLEGVRNTSGHFMLMSPGCGPHCRQVGLSSPPDLSLDRSPPGARFSKDPETFRAQRQILKSKLVE